MEDEEIKTLVTRLARPRPGGGTVVERSQILAEGADFTAVMKWIVDHGGEPEETAAAAPKGGLYGARLSDSGGGSATRQPSRFVLPAAALG
jgi:hypothetical protein